MRRERGLADLAHDLTFGAVVLVEIDFGSITSRTFAVVIYVAFGSSFDRFDRLVFIFVAPGIISHEVVIIPGFDTKDQREFINLKFLIFRRMGIVISPLFKRDVSTDKVYQPTILLIEILNDLK